MSILPLRQTLLKGLFCLSSVTSLFILSGCGSDADEQAPETVEHSGPTSEDQKRSVSSKAGSMKFSGPDIAGIYIGMTPEQVEAVYEAEEPGYRRTQSVQRTFQYNVLGKRMQTDPFVSAIVAERTAPNERILVEAGIAPPPSEGKVVAVKRYHRKDLQRLPRADYRAALIEKYGPPSEEQELNDTGHSVLRLTWLLGGGSVQCIESPLSPVIGESLLTRALDSAGKPKADQASTMADCANFLVYELHEDPVRVANGVMWDVAAEVEAQTQAQQWVQKLQEDASKPGAEKPKL